ncbi:glycosyltransferase family 4 protein [Flavobacterium ardleyense]|uniref:Glycosyltransferase family 4 protein n=1 Tax=Flavobacterium ardleyense TaxID=2038737 RepID=A0ABW5ZBA7_9FLAO
MELKIKKIAVLCDYHLSEKRVGGMDRFFWLFDAACKQLGHEVTWFFPNNERHCDYINFNSIAANGKSIEATFLEENQKFDLIFTHFLELCTPFYKQVKKQKLAKQIIAVDHNPRPFEGYPIKKRIQKKIKGWFYASYIDLFIGVSNYTVEAILKDFGQGLSSKTIVIYNGIEQQRFTKRRNRAKVKPTFLVACHLRFSKGIQDLIEAVYLVPTAIQSHIKIDVYGEGAYQIDLEKRIANKNLVANFIFKGSVSNLYDVYHKYDYLLQPTHMECFSLAILESLSANVPVITTPVGGNEEVIQNGKNGFIIPVQNPECLSQLIQQLYLGEKGIVEETYSLIEEQFSIERMVLDYCNLINK